MADQTALAVDEKVKDPAAASVQGRADASMFGLGGDMGPGFGGMFLVNIAQRADDTPPWNPLYINTRDRFLKEFARTEPMLASAVQSMKMRIQTLNYQWNAPPRAKKFGQELLNNPGLGDNLIQVTGKFIDDILNSDNGAFLEVWKAGKPDRPPPKDAPVMGFAHLDSRQCWRSFDPEFPVWYTNPQSGAVRKIHKDRVIMQSANAQPTELARNIGFSPVSIVLRMARIMRSTLIYRDEKITGGFTRAIGAIAGVSKNQVTAALRSVDEDAEGKGFVIYKGIPFLIQPNLEAGNDIKIVLQDLASIPDGFEFKTDVDLYAYILAFAFGVDAREFWPATQSGATKADATVQNMKARGRMIGYLVQMMEWVLRQCLPETGEFSFDYTDDEQDEMAARIQGLHLTNLNILKTAGAINALEMRALAIAEGVIDGKLLETLDIPVDAGSDPATSEDEDDSLEPNTQDSSEPQDENLSAAARKSVDSYTSNLRYYVRHLWTGEIGLFDFIDGFQKSIRFFFPEAWGLGAALCGITPDEMTDEERVRLNLEINTEFTYVVPFGQAIIEGSKANGGALQPYLDRVALWGNTYNRILTLGQSMACADQRGVWVLGRTEKHCYDCLGYAGRVYRMSVWRKFLEPYNALPKGHGLACGGWNCDCAIDITTAPFTRGYPPKPVGGFKAHNHEHIDKPELAAV